MSSSDMNKTAMQTLIEWGDKMLKENPNKILSFAEAIDKAEELLEMETEQMRRMYVLCHKADFLPPEILEENFQHYYKQILNTPKNPKQ